MKLIDPKITILVDRDGATIEVMDSTSHVTFLRVEMTPEQLAMALGRMAYTPCNAEVYAIESVGKRLETDTLRFEIPHDTEYKHRKKVASAIAEKVCPEGWHPDNYFGSKSSFCNEGEKTFAQTTIRRWVPVQSEETQA